MEAEYERKKLQKITAKDIGSNVATFGWISTVRHQKTAIFIDLYSAFTTIKCVYFTTTPIDLTPQTTILIEGEVKINESKTDDYEFEIHIKTLQICGKPAPPLPINSESAPSTLLDYGHLTLRTKARQTFLIARDALLRAFREYYVQEKFIEVTPPTLVQTQVEGGSTLFDLKYYDMKAYLTQSSQLYLETVAPVAGSCYCIMPSYRAEKSNTPRHLSEYTHVEAEMADIEFDELLEHIQEIVTKTVNRFYDLMGIEEVKDAIPGQGRLTAPFERVKYAEAIEILKKHGVQKIHETGPKLYEFGDDISDRDEVELVKIIGKGPVFMTHFHSTVKPFYVQKDGEFTYSVDLLYPGIGEIVGGSMRMTDYDSLMKGFEREGIDPKPYYWYTDMALYGPSSHGGYGLGLERLLRALMGYDNVTKCCLYPRLPNRCDP